MNSSKSFFIHSVQEKHVVKIRNMNLPYLDNQQLSRDNP